MTTLSTLLGCDFLVQIWSLFDSIIKCQCSVRTFFLGNEVRYVGQESMWLGEVLTITPVGRTLHSSRKNIA